MKEPGEASGFIVAMHREGRQESSECLLLRSCERHNKPETYWHAKVQSRKGPVTLARGNVPLIRGPQ